MLLVLVRRFALSAQSPNPVEVAVDWRWVRSSR